MINLIIFATYLSIILFTQHDVFATNNLFHATVCRVLVSFDGIKKWLI